MADFDRVGAKVTIGLLDGRMQNRKLRRFSPLLTVLAAEPVDGKGPPEPIALSKIAYVGFLKQPGVKPVARSNETVAKVIVHTAGGKRFRVEMVQPKSNGAPTEGFYAYAVDVESPFEGFYFFSHGINTIENDAPIGQMLVEQGDVAAADLQRGLERQNPPIGQILLEQERVNPEALDLAVAIQARKHLRLGEVLVEAGLLTPADVEKALAEQKKRRGMKIGEVLLALGLINEVTLAKTLGQKFNIPYVNLDAEPIDPEAAKAVPRELVERYGFLPVGVDATTLVIAISDPLNNEIADVLRFHVGAKRVRELIATATQLKTKVREHLDRAAGETAASEVDHLLKQLQADDVANIAQSIVEESSIKESDSAVIKLTNQIILDGYRRGASDIHIEPRGADRDIVVRFRIDGDCVVYKTIPALYRAPLVARIKIMANLDISERRKPQDGKIRLKLPDRQLELRVATLPSVNQNEDVVMRILAASRPLPLTEMGMAERNLRALEAVIRKPYGLMLCVGPTGSGKTTTLHSILGALNSEDTKIWTAEDPVEITQEGLRQVQVQPKIGFDFAAAMRSFLRADPDVIMVGEMRDEETASTAVEASLTGHLVFSTLHTNSAPETITRLLDMGLDPFSFADALLGTLAQRLARRLCPACRSSYEVDRKEYDEVASAYGREALQRDFGVQSGADLRLWRASGCDNCGNTGYKGRIGLHELLITNDDMKQAIQQKATVRALRERAVADGMTTLLQDGIAKCIQGQTDMRQVLAVCAK